MKKLYVTTRSYCYEITEKQMLALHNSESFSKPDPEGGSLFDKLSKIPGLSHIEYNGHFGCAVYFTIADEDDTADFRREVIAVIDTHINALLKAGYA